MSHAVTGCHSYLPKQSLACNLWNYRSLPKKEALCWGALLIPVEGWCLPPQDLAFIAAERHQICEKMEINSREPDLFWGFLASSGRSFQTFLGMLKNREANSQWICSIFVQSQSFGEMTHLQPCTKMSHIICRKAEGPEISVEFWWESSGIVDTKSWIRLWCLNKW